MELADIRGKLAKSGYQILAISPDQPAKIKQTVDRGKLGYTLLSEPNKTPALRNPSCARTMPEPLPSSPHAGRENLTSPI